MKAGVKEVSHIWSCIREFQQVRLNVLNNTSHACIHKPDYRYVWLYGLPAICNGYCGANDQLILLALH